MGHGRAIDLTPGSPIPPVQPQLDVLGHLSAFVGALRRSLEIGDDDLLTRVCPRGRPFRAPPGGTHPMATSPRRRTRLRPTKSPDRLAIRSSRRRVACWAWSIRTRPAIPARSPRRLPCQHVTRPPRPARVPTGDRCAHRCSRLPNARLVGAAPRCPRASPGTICADTA